MSGGIETSPGFSVGIPHALFESRILSASAALGFRYSPAADGKRFERRDFLDICDEGYQARSTLLTSQLPVSAWHAQVGDPTIADSILDRLVHNAHRIELTGDSMRKKRKGKSEGEKQS